MQPRMKNPVMMIPGAFEAIMALGEAAKKGGVPLTTHGLIHIRASQINGCGLCLDMHAHEMKEAGEKDERIFAVGAWRDAPFFTDAERAALALTEAVTRQADKGDAVPDELWQEVKRHYDEPALASLILSIGMINLWNRLNATTRQLAGSMRR